jgi:hypothetical protein
MVSVPVPVQMVSVPVPVPIVSRKIQILNEIQVLMDELRKLQASE